MINYPLEVAIASMLIAQLIKYPIYYVIYRKWYPMIIFSTGGMPSSHSAFVTALTLAIALTEGVASPYFAISFVVAGVVIHDSIGIRKEAGKHASVLNTMSEEIHDILDEMKRGEEADRFLLETKLKELLGHEPIEALSGVILGALIVLATMFII